MAHVAKAARGRLPRLRYCPPSPKVFNALAHPAAGLRREWMRHFPGQDVMNETDCCITRQEAPCIPQIKKANIKAVLPFCSSKTVEGREITSLMRLCQEVSPLSHARQRAGIWEPWSWWILICEHVLVQGSWEVSRCWAISSCRRTRPLCECGRLLGGADLQVTFALNTLTGFCEPVIVEPKFLQNYELQSWRFSYPQSCRPNQCVHVRCPRTSWSFLGMHFERWTHLFNSAAPWLWVLQYPSTSISVRFFPLRRWRKVNEHVLCHHLDVAILQLSKESQPFPPTLLPAPSPMSLPAKHSAAAPRGASSLEVKEK